MRTAYKCRAYPDPDQAAILARTFGCVRVVWNRTLAARQHRWATERKSMSYRETDAALTAMKRLPELAWLNKVSSVPLQQALRHQRTAFTAFFAGRARYAGRAIGIDLGLTSFAVTSDGLRISNPRHLARKTRNLARYQRRMARKRNGSANRRKAAAKVARAHHKVRAARADFLHRTSTRLVRDHDLLVIEDLNVRGMIGNRHLARAISDCGWATFRAMLAYEAERAGRRLVVIDRWYPSSRTCSACGRPLAHLSMDTRTWQCPSCGARHDRDINAAKNILAAGRAVAACGADVSHSGSLRVQSALKQEPSSATKRIPALHGRD
jgi:putative transposase